MAGGCEGYWDVSAHDREDRAQGDRGSRSQSYRKARFLFSRAVEDFKSTFARLVVSTLPQPGLGRGVNQHNAKRRPRQTWSAVCVQCGGSLGRRIHNALICMACIDVGKQVKRVAHQAVKKAILAGKIRPVVDLLCDDCGDPAAIYDHRDYSKPLDVAPVCRSCNIRRGPGRYKAAA